MRLKKIPNATEFLKESNIVTFLSKESEQIAVQHEEIELEIGCGKGDFIISRAKKNPETQYYAIEKFDSVLMRAVEKQMEQLVENVHFISGDAEDLGVLFPKKSIDRIFLNFSDPWPKSRHVKRRLTYSAKLELYRELLKEGAPLELKTDNRNLFEFSLMELSQNSWVLDEVSIDVHQQVTYEEPVLHLTEYEKKFMEKGNPIYYLRAHSE